MGWVSLLFWGAAGLRARGGRRGAAFALAYAAGIAASMLCQLRLLWLDGLMSVETALPLHLCGLMGVLSPLLVWRAPAWLYELSFFLGAPCALATLCFPAVIASSRPALMALAFGRLHALVALAPLCLMARGLPPPTDPRRAFALANAYLLLVAAFNHAMDTNYLFLARAPAGTPLEWLRAGGGTGYALALEMLCMLLMRGMAGLARAYRRKYGSM